MAEPDMNQSNQDIIQVTMQACGPSSKLTD